MARKPAPASPRDRVGTERAILNAAREVLSETGPSGFGVNAIARRAGCDKQLIYRYFGGLDGLVDAIGEDLSGLFKILLSEPDDKTCDTYPAFVEHLVLALLDAFRSSDLLLRIAAWEVLDPTPVTKRLAMVRGQALNEWVQARRNTLAIPADADAGAINAVLIAAVQHLALSARAIGSFGGVKLEDDSDWERVRAVISRMAHAAYASDTQVSSDSADTVPAMKPPPST